MLYRGQILRGVEMLNSSKEYLNALRQGHYLLFLEWPRFMVERYTKDSTITYTGDDLVELLIYEWLHFGFEEEDTKRIALIYKVQEIEPTIFSGDLAYSIITISIAMHQCMIFFENNIHPHFISSVKNTKQEILAFIAEHDIESVDFQISLQTQQTKFNQLVELVSEKQIKEVIKKIEPMLSLRQCLGAYQRALEKPSIVDELHSARLALVKRLIKYMQEQTVLTEEVVRALNLYNNKIWELSPSKEEEEYLLAIAPLSLSAKAWRVLADVGGLFFDNLKPKTELANKEDKPQLKIT